MFVRNVIGLKFRCYGVGVEHERISREISMDRHDDHVVTYFGGANLICLVILLEPSNRKHKGRRIFFHPNNEPEPFETQIRLLVELVAKEMTIVTKKDNFVEAKKLMARKYTRQSFERKQLL